MIIDDVSEVLLSAEKFRLLYQCIRSCYEKLNEAQSAIYDFDKLLGTAVKESISAKRLQTAQIEEFERGFGI